MNKRKLFAALLVEIGLFLMALPFALKYGGEHEAEILMEKFEERIEGDDKEEEPSSADKKRCLTFGGGCYWHH